MYKRAFLFLSLLLISSLTQAIDTPAPERETFQIKAEITDPNTLLLRWNIKDGNFLYKDRFKFITSIHQQLGPIRYPTTHVEKKYPDKTYQVYRNELTIPLALLSDEPGSFPLTVNHQGCADSGFCYPPTQTTFQISVDKKGGMTNVAEFVPTTKSPTIEKSLQHSEQNSPYDTLFENHNLFFIMLSFYGFGLLLAFTPCVLPMVPVLSGIIVGQHKNISSRRGLLLSICYVSGMSISYALVGILIAAVGQNLQTLFQSPIFIGAFAALFVILALSMFDFYNLSLPTSWQAKLASQSNKQNNGAYIGAASMGALSTLILSPCVTAPLVGALSYIAKTSNMLIGGTSLLFLGFGMGTPLILLGASAGKLLPKAGNWMNHIKHSFGIVLLIMAISLAERIVPAPITMLCWSALLLICGVFLISLNKHVSNNHAIFGVGIGLLPLCYGFLILIGLALGNTSPYTPLKNSAITSRLSAPGPIANKPIIATDLATVESILENAKQAQENVFIDFYADWCAACKEMDEKVFTDLEVQQRLQHLVWLKIDVTQRNDASKTLEKKFNVVAPPTLIMLSKTGKEKFRIVGETPKAALLKML